jgi:FtsH-binding integral membrane protein
MFHTHTKNILKRMMGLSLLASLAFVALLSLAQTNAALAQTAPPLGEAATFAVLGASTVTNTATPTVVVGNLGVSPGSAITGFPPGTLTGGTIQTPSTACYPGSCTGTESPTAQADALTAYNYLASTVH